MSRVRGEDAEDVMFHWQELQAAEDEMLQHVKDVARRIAIRVRNVLGESEDDEQFGYAGPESNRDDAQAPL